MRSILIASAGLVLAFVALLVLLAYLVPAKPLTFSSTVDIAMPAADAWHRLRDLSLAHRYVPGIERTEITTPNREGVGTSRRVYTSESSYINESVVRWHDGRGFDLELHDDEGAAPAPFEQARFSYLLVKLGERNTRLEASLTVTMRGGITGMLAAKTLLARTFQSRIDAVTASLKQFYLEDRTSVARSPYGGTL